MEEQQMHRRAEDRQRAYDPNLSVLQAQVHEIGKAVAALQGSPEKGALEKHFQTIFSTLILGILAWVGTSTLESRENIIKLSSSSSTIESRLSEVKNQINMAMSTNYTKDDANRDLVSVLGRIKAVEDKQINMDKHLMHIRKEYDVLLLEHDKWKKMHDHEDENR